MRAHICEVKHPARARVRPPVPDRTIDQAQQLELGLRAHARGDRAEKPERCLPRCNVNSTAISFSASDSRPFSCSRSLDLRLLGRRRPARLRRRERRQRRILRQRPEPDDHTHVDALLAGRVGLRDLLRGDLQKHLPLLLRRQLPTLARLPFSIITSSWFRARTASQD